MPLRNAIIWYPSYFQSRYQIPTNQVSNHKVTWTSYDAFTLLWENGEHDLGYYEANIEPLELLFYSLIRITGLALNYIFVICNVTFSKMWVCWNYLFSFLHCLVDVKQEPVLWDNFSNWQLVSITDWVLVHSKQLVTWRNPVPRWYRLLYHWIW
jgi:hypothetical protein